MQVPHFYNLILNYKDDIIIILSIIYIFVSIMQINYKVLKRILINIISHIYISKKHKLFLSMNRLFLKKKILNIQND